MTRNISFLVFIMVSIPMWVLGQDTVVYSLDDIIAKIDKQNVSLQSYALKVESYDYKAEAVKAWMAPMIGGGTYMTPYPGQQTMNDKGSLMFQLEQELPNFSQQKAEKKAILSQVEIEAASREIALNSLRSSAKKLYFNWVIAEKRIDVLEENQQLMEIMKEVEEIRYKHNQGQLGNIFSIDAQIESNQNELLTQTSKIAEYRAWLRSMMNESDHVFFTVDTAADLAFDPLASLDTTYLANQRLDIEKINREVDKMELDVDVMRKESKPTIKLRLDHMSPLGTGMMPNSYSIMGMVSIPIAPWSKKMYKNEVKAMNLQVEARLKERKGLLIESEGKIKGLQYQILNLEQRIENMETKIIPSLKRALDANFQSYQENKIALPVIIDNWESWNLMHNNLLDEQLNLYEMIIAYEKELFK